MGNDEFRKKLAVGAGSAALVLASSAAYGIGPLTVGEWELDFSGNINGYYTYAQCRNKSNGAPVFGGVACGSNQAGGDGTAGRSRDVNAIQTGFLPAWFGFSAKTQQKGYDVGLTIGFQPGIDSAAKSNDLDTGLGLNNSNFRQVFLTLGQESWGTVKIGRDLGIFGSDAILEDMTLLGIGAISDISTGGGNTTLGRIGTGYIYADWRAQISYKSPDWNGLQFEVGVFDPWGITPGLTSSGTVSASATDFNQEASSPAVQGDISYAWEGDFAGKVWGGFNYQSISSATEGVSSIDQAAGEFGLKVSYVGFDLVGYYYTAQALGTSVIGWDAVATIDDDNNPATPNVFKDRDSDGWWVQGRYKVAPWGTKLGVAYGRGNLDLASGESNSGSGLVRKNEAITAGVYHPLTDALNLVFEYNFVKATAHNGNKAEETNFGIGAILFY